jgi:hypothetical protein
MTIHKFNDTRQQIIDTAETSWAKVLLPLAKRDFNAGQ